MNRLFAGIFVILVIALCLYPVVDTVWTPLTTWTFSPSIDSGRPSYEYIEELLDECEATGEVTW